MEFEDLRGKTLTAVMREGDDRLTFTDSDGTDHVMQHHQDCCERVEIQDICGDLDDLLDTPILIAVEDSHEDDKASESGTWTFYNLATIKGSVTVRWYGASNGYYSERVSFGTAD